MGAPIGNQNAAGPHNMGESHRLRNTIIGALAGSAVMPVVGTVIGGAIGYASGAPQAQEHFETAKRHVETAKGHVAKFNEHREKLTKALGG